MEQEIMQLITYGGDARSKALLALKEIANNNFAEAEELLQQANENIITAHKVQTQLLQQEASGEGQTVQLLMVHAQDHLMDAMVIYDLTKQILVLQKNNLELINSLKK